MNPYNQVITTTYMDTEWQPTRDKEREFAIVRYEYKGTNSDEP